MAKISFHLSNLIRAGSTSSTQPASKVVAGIKRLINSHWLTGQCIFCGGPSQPQLDCCLHCEHSLPLIEQPCHQCALPIPPIPITSEATTKPICGQCQQTPPPFVKTVACWLYLPPLAQLISSYKYQRKLSYGNNLAKLATKSIAASYLNSEQPDLIIATALHWRRYYQRGFNQSELLANYFSHHFQIPLSKSLKRRKVTPAQQSLNALQRRRNLRGAFEVTQPEAIQGRRVALVDDVMTTGATATEISSTLLNAGAREVHIWVLARTPNQ